MNTTFGGSDIENSTKIDEWDLSTLQSWIGERFGVLDTGKITHFSKTDKEITCFYGTVLVVCPNRPRYEWEVLPPFGETFWVETLMIRVMDNAAANLPC